MNHTELDRPHRPRVTPATAAQFPDARDIHAAHERIRPHIHRSPCEPAAGLGASAGVRLFLKREDLQATGSFKERGAANALALLSEPERTRGVVAASAGNHALGLARHGARLQIPVTLVMPTGAARVKVERCRAHGAEVVLAGDSFADADRFGLALARERGARYVHPFDDRDVIAGQGTVALEVLEQVPDLAAIVVPVGGGGLLAGVAVAVKSRRPDVRVIAVEPENAASFRAAWRHGAPRNVPVVATLADGLAVGRVGTRNFAAALGRVDDVVTVTEREIAIAMKEVDVRAGIRAEGAGAVALAALLARRLPKLDVRTVVALVGGRNVDSTTFARALELADGARCDPREKL